LLQILIWAFYSGSMTNKERIPLSDELLSEIKGHIDRTLVGPHLLLKKAGKPVPKGLSTHTLENWLYKRCETVRADFVEFVLEEWRALLDGDLYGSLPRNRKAKPKPGYVEITPEVRCELEAYRQAKFIPGRIFKEFSDVPDGLQPSMISAWVNGSGKTAREVNLNYVITCCQQLGNRAV
jgi:hypothetical protein